MVHVIAGGGIAAASAIEAIRSKDSTCKIILIAEEEAPPYSKVMLPEYMEGKRRLDELFLRGSDFFIKYQVKALLGERIERIIPADKKVVLKDGIEIPYDTLLITTGASPVVISSLCPKRPGMFFLRTLRDAQRLMEYARGKKRAVIAGGGLIGLKAAGVMKEIGLEVTVVEKLPWLLPAQVDEKGGRIFERIFRDAGYQLLIGCGVEAIEGKNKVEGIYINGKLYGTDVVIIAAGVKANCDIVRETGIETDEGIIVDSAMRTKSPFIFAAGDVAQAYDIVMDKTAWNPRYQNAVIQGRIAGLNMVGEDNRYDTSLAMNSVSFYGIPIATTGVISNLNNGDSIWTEEFSGKNIYKKIVLRNGKIIGMLLIGDITNAGVIHWLIRRQIEIGDRFEEVVRGRFNYSTMLSSGIEYAG